jgi:hypothetical protein
MKSEIHNIPASIHARLQRYAQSTRKPFQEVFYYYAIERFLYRLSQTKYRRSFVLKGGLAFFGWGISLRRPTRDIDLHAFIRNSREELERVIKEICEVQDEADGMLYDVSAIRLETIMADAKYEGVRARFPAFLGKANIILQIDVSFANVITPSDIEIDYPTLLNPASFRLRAYNRESAIAEKFQAMVFLGNYNSRIKDFGSYQVSRSY